MYSPSHYDFPTPPPTPPGQPDRRGLLLKHIRPQPQRPAPRPPTPEEAAWIKEWYSDAPLSPATAARVEEFQKTTEVGPVVQTPQAKRQKK
jgi:hypothetical protein